MSRAEKESIYIPKLDLDSLLGVVYREVAFGIHVDVSSVIECISLKRTRAVQEYTLHSYHFIALFSSHILLSESFDLDEPCCKPKHQRIWKNRACVSILLATITRLEPRSFSVVYRKTVKY